MASTNDNLGDYRARAAACRAMAESAQEFPSETRTWLQIAEMWEGLAARAEGRPVNAHDAAPSAPGDGAHATNAVSLPADAPAGGSRHRGQEGGAAPQRSGVRRVAVIAGFLLLPVLALAAFLPGTGKRTPTVQAQAPIVRAPETPATKSADPSPPQRATVELATTPPPPAPAPETATAPPPSQERVANAAGVAGNAEAMSETGSVGQRPEPEPEVAPLEPPTTAPSRQKLAALPNPQRLQARDSEPDTEPAPSPAKLTGTWWPTTCPKPAERKNAVRMELGTNRAKAGAASCTFLKKTQTGPAWTVLAKCSDGKASWTAHIRLVLEGKRLQWASERGTQTYLRCG